jgi:methylated-DNA-[protein]-cysteine S-methyltransferase
MLVTCTLDSPLGRLGLVARPGALVGVSLPGQAGGPPADAAPGELPVLAAAREQLAAYFAGERVTFDLPLAPVGTPFQRAVWDRLLAIPPATTISYGELAARLGRPHAARAVGTANARNPLAIVVPCHRVIGGSGQLTGYAGGLPAKRWLLDHERRAAARGRAASARVT